VYTDILQDLCRSAWSQERSSRRIAPLGIIRCRYHD
jgi:hypothetical protein